MKKTAVVLTTLVGLLSPSISVGTKLNLEERKSVSHDMSQSGIFYGSGIEHLTYTIKIEKADVKTTHYETLATIARQLEERVYGENSCHPTTKNIVEEIVTQNVDLYAAWATEYLIEFIFGQRKRETMEPVKLFSLLREGDVLHYRTARTYGKGLMSVL